MGSDYNRRNIYKKYRLTIWEATPALEEHTLFIINNSDTLEYLHQINNNVYKGIYIKLYQNLIPIE